MKKIKHNAAIIILAARISFLYEAINSLYRNWNLNYKYPLYIHTLGHLINDNLRRISSKIILLYFNV